MSTVFELTWHHDENRAVSDSSTVANLSASLAWYIYSVLTGNVGGLTSGAWTIYSSCRGNGGTNFGNGDTVDWIDATTFTIGNWTRNTAGNNHTWFVLKSPSIGGTFYYMIFDYSGSAANTPLNLSFSKTAPTGGTATAAPTAADSWSHAANTQFNDNTASASKVHAHLSTSGNFIIYSSKNGAGQAHVGFIFAALTDTKAADQIPVCSFANYNTSGCFLASGAVSTTLWKGRTFNNSGAATIGGAYLGGGNDVYGSVAVTGDAVDQTFPDSVIYMVGMTTAQYGVRGRLPDIAWNCLNQSQGDVEPGPAGPIVRTVVGRLWIPASVAPSF